MAFADPLTVTVGVDDIVLPRTTSGANMSEYTSADGELLLKASSNYARRTRRVIRLDANKFTPDPFIPANNTKVSLSVYTVLDYSPVGWTPTEVLEYWNGLNTLVMASGYLIGTQLIAGES